ncbi:MAG: hypothetical protein QUS14_06035 [Pyrinomonadaceae bacterium]|nr:hypothetical protein [Pyrinomonadaceae bacterium]
MVVRAIALSIALLIGVGTMIPLATEYAEAGAKKTKRYKKKRNWKGVKKYSKRWWQLYRAQERRKKAMAQRRRALRLRQLRLARARQLREQNAQAGVKSAPASTAKKAAVLPSGDPAPQGWTPSETSNSEVKFRVTGNSGAEVGSASISVVGPATGETVATGRNRTLGGVPTTSLRREVINRMVRENGWVVNDYQKEVGGKTVYVVVAQSQEGSGRVQSRLFYFTEAGGRIYSVAANASTDAAERLAEESEKVIESIQSRPRPAQQAAMRED